MDSSEKDQELPGEGKPEQAGQREELVSIDDIKLVSVMTKDELDMYSITRFGVDLQKGEKVKLLRTKVIMMINDRLKGPKAEQTEKNPVFTTDKNATGNPEFIFNPANRKIFDWTPNLATRLDFKVCYIVDEKGKRL